MERPVALGDEPCIRELVERALLEADRERAQRLARLLCGQRGKRARVDAAREQYADGHVADEVRADGVAQPRAQLLDQLRFVVLARLECGRRAREATQFELAV